jgi:hypothetical protein
MYATWRYASEDRCLHTKSDMPGYNGSIIDATKTKDKNIFTAMFLLLILKKQCSITTHSLPRNHNHY